MAAMRKLWISKRRFPGISQIEPPRKILEAPRLKSFAQHVNSPPVCANTTGRASHAIGSQPDHNTLRSQHRRSGFGYQILDSTLRCHSRDYKPRFKSDFGATIHVHPYAIYPHWRTFCIRVRRACDKCSNPEPCKQLQFTHHHPSNLKYILIATQLPVQDAPPQCFQFLIKLVILGIRDLRRVKHVALLGVVVEQDAQLNQASGRNIVFAILRM